MGTNFSLPKCTNFSCVHFYSRGTKRLAVVSVLVTIRRSKGFVPCRNILCFCSDNRKTAASALPTRYYHSFNQCPVAPGRCGTTKKENKQDVAFEFGLQEPGSNDKTGAVKSAVCHFCNCWGAQVSFVS
jgi:hypothetical protein